MYATHGSNPKLADFARGHNPRATAFQGIRCKSVTHAREPRLGQIHSLGRKAQSFYEARATLGVKMSTENKREFTEEQMNAGKTTVGVLSH